LGLCTEWSFVGGRRLELLDVRELLDEELVGVGIGLVILVGVGL